MFGIKYLGVALAAWLVPGISAGDAGAQGRPDRPVVVELFTSQSCYSCPSAVTTDVQRGENSGKRLDNYHIVTELTRIGDWRGRAVTLDVPNVRPGSEEGCAVLVQGDKPGDIIGAAKCPSSGA